MAQSGRTALTSTAGSHKDPTISEVLFLKTQNSALIICLLVPAPLVRYGLVRSRNRSDRCLVGVPSSHMSPSNFTEILRNGRSARILSCEHVLCRPPCGTNTPTRHSISWCNHKALSVIREQAACDFGRVSSTLPHVSLILPSLSMQI